METARLVLDRGGTVCIFPEGTRIRSGSLGTPKRGVGRLALETGAAVAPVAVHGSELVRRGWRIRPRKVKLRVGRPLTFPRTEHPSPALAATVTGSDLAQRRAPVGVARRSAAAAQGRGDRRRELGHRDGRAAGSRRTRGPARDPLPGEGGGDRRQAARTLATCPGRRLPETVAVKRAGDIELAGVDLVCLAVPSAALPAAVGSLGDRIGSRAAVLLLTKGLVQPLGQLPSEYVGERIRARAIASLGGPAHAREAAAGMAALVLGSTDADLRAQLGEVFDRAGLVCERSDDVVGVEMAGAAKNAASLGAAAAEALRPQRRGDRRRDDLARVRRVRARRRRPAGHLHRARRRGRPDRDRDGAREPQPARRRAARRRRCRRTRSRGGSARRPRASTRCRCLRNRWLARGSRRPGWTGSQP